MMGKTKPAPTSLSNTASECGCTTGPCYRLTPDFPAKIAGFANEIYEWLETTDGINILLKKLVRPRFGDHRNQSVL
jgi:hypothetical protein